jgi:hypothetical protein
MLYADHSENEKFGNGGAGYGWGSGGSPENFAYWMETWNYTEITAVGTSGDRKVNPIQRETIQGLGRPWTRMAPVADAFLKGGVWEDDVKAIHSRYDATFTLRYHTNTAKPGANAGAWVYGANGMKVNSGEVYFSFVDEATAGAIDWTPTKAMIKDGDKLVEQEVTRFDFGKLPGRADFVRSVKNISRKCYPINWKISIARTDTDNSYNNMVNGGSPRPWSVAKFSEFYLIAAEAAVKLGKNADAYNFVKVLRERAGKQTFNQNDNVAVSVDKSAEMIAATPTTITIDFILDERSREFWGEGYRWFDLVRTQKWAERASVYHIAGNEFTDKDLKEVHRDIPAGYYIRPIPQGQLDGMEMSPEEKDAYQNPAYR